ncbi:uncharacterized protein LOC105702142 [Orussus abietinus]|uniref:uncharacterized protein LOC105702142 n=1 Tax=Orussus abietinus TaxID=222816 RepID=UPI000626E777|nr:uncharacterized protein LOC105702142 [Orussus abietinus]
MAVTETDAFSQKMRRATREIHAVSDALVNAKLVLGFSDNAVWADGLLVFYEIFRFLEGAMVRLKDTKVGLFRIPALQRTEAFEQDLEFYLGNGWKKNYAPRESVIKYLMRLREVEDTDPMLLMAYIYHLYMGLLSGGIILRKKRQFIQKFLPNKSIKSNSGDKITDFGDANIFELKSELRSTLNRIAETLDEDTRNKLIEESGIVYTLNNEIIRSVKGANTVVIKKAIYFISILILSFLVFLAVSK